MSQARDELKRRAAEAAAELVEDGMIVGLGTGSTAALAISALIRRHHGGLRFKGIPTSERSGAQAEEGGIELTTLGEVERIDLTIDGADEVAHGSLDLVKGLGGALLREKIVAAASDRLVIVVDHAKLVDRLGQTTHVPVEVVPFGWEATARHVRALGGQPTRRIAGNAPFLTDGGNFILDCQFGPIDDPTALDSALQSIVGVVETGFFIGRTSAVLVADAGGVHRLEPR